MLVFRPLIFLLGDSSRFHTKSELPLVVLEPSHISVLWNFRGFQFFPTCQVRVVRFYVSLFSFSSFSSASSSVSSSVTLSCRDSVSSVWHAGPQLRSCEFSVACWTPTAILMSSVWRAGPQPRPCEFSVASRTPTAIL